MFNVECTGTDESQKENAVIGIVDELKDGVVHSTYTSTAPAQAGDEYIQIEVASSYGNYGAYDNPGITAPEIYE